MQIGVIVTRQICHSKGHSFAIVPFGTVIFTLGDQRVSPATVGIHSLINTWLLRFLGLQPGHFDAIQPRGRPIWRLFQLHILQRAGPACELSVRWLTESDGEEIERTCFPVTEFLSAVSAMFAACV